MNQKDQTPSNTPDPQWEELVARMRQDDAASSPDAGNGVDPADPSRSESEASSGQTVPHEPTAAERAAQLHRLFNTGPLARGPRDYQAPEDETDREFIPDEPPALGSGDPSLMLAWVATAGGALGLLFCVIFVRNVPGILTAALAIATLVGVIMLLRRLPKDRDPGDDGARV